jgi:transcriptional regulator GlxA family with amidase domain
LHRRRASRRSGAPGRSNRHHALGNCRRFSVQYPKINWQTHLAVTEDRGVFCGGGLYSAIDLALYLVEKLCDRQTAIEVAKALVLQMPRTYQTSFACYRSAPVTATPPSGVPRNG